MQDRLRFRFWDTKNNKIVTMNERLMYTGRVFNLDLGNMIYASKRFIPMQCTGLKDKNGKLIFEGDIIKLDDELFCVAEFHKKYDRNFGRVEFILIGGQLISPAIYIPTVAHESEVIGNIYENEELLEGSNG